MTLRNLSVQSTYKHLIRQLSPTPIWCSTKSDRASLPSSSEALFRAETLELSRLKVKEHF